MAAHEYTLVIRRTLGNTCRLVIVFQRKRADVLAEREPWRELAHYHDRDDQVRRRIPRFRDCGGGGHDRDASDTADVSLRPRANTTID